MNTKQIALGCAAIVVGGILAGLVAGLVFEIAQQDAQAELDR